MEERLGPEFCGMKMLWLLSNTVNERTVVATKLVGGGGAAAAVAASGQGAGASGG